ncbi:MAG: carboxy terminal-processing peptidase [Ignavibacteriales bacterium]|nr:carboxy terminal-processing peptidase [Ignavibacteriales bacterium]
MKKLFFIWFLFVLVTYVPANSFPEKIKQDGDTITTLQPESKHQKSDLLIMTLLTRYHYKKTNVNDSLASIILDRYLQSLDYSKTYFLASDIEGFKKYRTELDDDLKIGRLKPAYDIYNKFIERLKERDNYIYKVLDTEPDFTVNEYYEVDRKNANWINDETDLNDIWRKRIKNEALNEILKGKTWKETADILKKRYENFQKRMLQYNSEDVFQFYMNSFTEAIDPHTNYFSPVTSENFKINMSLSLEGIGAQLGAEDDYTKVVEVIAGGPAFKSNLIHKDDKIIAVAQGDTGKFVDVIGLRLDDVVKKIRGPKGTVVRLQILEAELGVNSTPKEIRLVREKVKLEEQAAKKEVIQLNEEGVPYKLGVITLPSFYFDYEAQARGEKDYKNATRDVKKLLLELKDEKVDGVILDLRNNGGGSLQEAIDLTGLFIKDGPVVQVRNSDGRIEVGTDPDNGIVYGGPLAVLVNRFSASASEIFAGAIQDYQRGLIIGEQTYGKGTVQNLIDLNRLSLGDSTKLGQLKITIAKFYRINGGSTQRLGVIPDIPFPSSADSNEFRESSEPSSLPYDQIASAKFNLFENLKEIIPKLLTKHDERVKDSAEFQNIIEEIDDYKAERQKKMLSLNLEQRKKEKDEAEEKRLQRLNERRQAAGLKLLQKGEVAPREDKLDDPLLKESANILADMILLGLK